MEPAGNRNRLKPFLILADLPDPLNLARRHVHQRHFTHAAGDGIVQLERVYPWSGGLG
jgi:hypothetical protein